MNHQYKNKYIAKCSFVIINIKLALALLAFSKFSHSEEIFMNVNPASSYIITFKMILYVFFIVYLL